MLNSIYKAVVSSCVSVSHKNYEITQLKTIADQTSSDLLGISGILCADDDETTSHLT